MFLKFCSKNSVNTCVTDIERKIMGLAAGQARLLSITGRKSDCEFQSMRLSHQKIALARELADLSNEYQDSLTLTKLTYDYYGTGTSDMQLSYSLMMTPTALNDYMPLLLTDQKGRVTLDSKLAAAAAAAGIPQEGLGCLPSEYMRNIFINALGDNGVIRTDLADKIMKLPYNQEAGFGGGVTVITNSESGNITDFLEYLKNNTNAFSVPDLRSKEQTGYNAKENKAYAWINLLSENYSKDKYYASTEVKSLTIVDLLEGKNQYNLAYEGIQGEQSPVYGIAMMQDFLIKPDGFIDWLMDEFSNILDVGDGYSAQALEYAYSMVTNLVYRDETLTNSNGLTGKDYWTGLPKNKNDDDKRKSGKETDEITEYENENVYEYLEPITTGTPNSANQNDRDKGTNEDEEYRAWVVEDSKNYMGFYAVLSNKGGSSDDGNDHATAALNLNNVANAFLTYFADYMNGLSKTSKEGIQVFDVTKGKLVENNHLATENYDFEYVWKIGKDVSSNDLGQATFYDALFNMICKSGWTENENVKDNQYLQQMLQNGMQFISRVNDDGYYYQGNYATDSYIKEVADESLIAVAEAKYTTEKAKLNVKEETIDLKMKNLDTEISSLTTEYDTVKNTISKNIEKSFKRYNA